jgi:hypothetical protein
MRLTFPTNGHTSLAGLLLAASVSCALASDHGAARAATLAPAGAKNSATLTSFPSRRG